MQICKSMEYSDSLYTLVACLFLQATEYFAVPTKLKSLDIETVKCPAMHSLKNNNVEIKERITYSFIVGLNHSELVTLQVC